MPQFIIHIYLYLLRFPYNVWLFVAKNLSLLSSLNKKEQINTRRDVAERVADGLSAGCGFSFDFAYQSCSTLIGILSSRTSKRKRPFAVSHRNCSWRRVNHLRVPSDDSRYRVSFLRSSRESFPLSLILLESRFPSIERQRGLSTQQGRSGLTVWNTYRYVMRNFGAACVRFMQIVNRRTEGNGSRWTRSKKSRTLTTRSTE